MKLSGMLATLIGLAVATPVLAQTAGYEQTPAYETPKYQAGPSTPLDKNFGLPTYGMPGSELPQLKTMAPVQRTPEKPDPFAPSTGLSDRDSASKDDTPTSDTPDFFNNPSNLDLPKTNSARPGIATMETPLYTTDHGDSADAPGNDMTTGTLGTANRFGSRSTMETGSFMEHETETGDTTGSGMTTR